MTDRFLIESDVLQGRIGCGDMIVIDCSWYAPEANKSGRAEYVKGHVPGARFFDLDAASDPTPPLPR